MVKKMKNLAKIAFGIVLVVGLIGCPNQTGNSARVDKQFSILDGSNISIDLLFSDVDIGVSPDANVHITYYDTDHFKYEITQNDNALILKLRIIKNNFNYPAEITKVTMLIPKEFSGALSVDTASGDTTISNISGKSIELNSKSGDTKAERISSTGNISITVMSGNINLNDVKSTDGTLTAKTSSGDKTLNIVSANTINLNSQSGKNNLSQIVCINIRIENTSGHTDFSGLDAKNISIKTSSGDVRGSLVGSDSDFSVTSHSNSGNNNLPAKWGSGSKKLDVSTISGNIAVAFAK